MKIHEFQGKEIFRRYGIPVPDGEIATTPDEAQKIAEKLGGKLVVKAQIHAGGRGKGSLTKAAEIHGVKVVTEAKDARAHAQALLGNALHTHQTGPEGQVVRRVLIERATDIAKEYYVGLVLDRETARVTFIASTEGGMEIEKVAAEMPEKILRLGVDPATGVQAFHGRKLAYGLGFTGDTANKAAKLLAKLYQVFIDTDASLVEINPLVLTKSGDVIALDAKVNFDDNAMTRHPELLALRDVEEEDTRERAAKDAELSYVALDGNIGCLVNGAGLAMSTMDIIKYVGGEPANFLDVGGGATAAQVTTAFKIILQDPKVKAILVNIFGGIAKCDVIASGIITAAKEVGLKMPLIVRLEGTNVELGKKLLGESGLSITPANDMLDAAKKAVKAAGGGK